MGFEERFKQVLEDRRALDRERAVLLSRKEDFLKRKETLGKFLQESGVNLQELGSERVRLEAEVNSMLTAAEGELKRLSGLYSSLMER